MTLIDTSLSAVNYKKNAINYCDDENLLFGLNLVFDNTDDTYCGYKCFKSKMTHETVLKLRKRIDRKPLQTQTRKKVKVVLRYFAENQQRCNKALVSLEAGQK